jgi:hypothetical protein
MFYGKVIAIDNLLTTCPWGHYGKHYHYGVCHKQDIFHEVFWVLVLLRTQREQLQHASFKNNNNKFIYKLQKSQQLQAKAGRPTCLQANARTVQQ